MLRRTALRGGAADGGAGAGGGSRRYFKKVLVANRGEIACRVMRTCKRLGIQTVAIYSQADAKAKHVRLADEAYCVGPPPSKDSYLRVDTILDVVRRSGADAVHPGYGFLSENSTFSRALADQGVTFVGPTERAIHAMGDKIESKRLARSLQVSTIPGYDGEIRSEEHLLEVTKQVGYPVMMKASAGGGGKGMRVAWNDDEAIKGFRLSKSEAAAAFGDDRMLVEKFVEEPRHIEIQILGDKLGNVLYLPERECSIQRRNQKVIEEAPSTFVHPEMRRAMGEQAAMLARGVEYHTAGTVEMMVDKHRNFYFLEMNTRLQVEHPITELITGLDLVEEMLRAAAGLPLSVRQEDVRIRGWATESRVYAEDPLNNFLPTIGRLARYEEPLEVEGVRVDSGIVAGSEISVYYDPLIAKLCTWGETRKESISRMRDALDAYVIRGLGRTNVNFLRDTMLHPKYLSGDITTKFIEQEYKNGYLGHQLTDAEKQEILAATAIMHSAKQLQHGGRPHDSPVTNEEWVVTLHEPHPQGTPATSSAAGVPSGVPDTIAKVTLTSKLAEGALHGTRRGQEFTGTITILQQGKDGKEAPVEGHGTGSFRLVTPWSPAQQLFRFTFEGSAGGSGGSDAAAVAGAGKWKYSQLVARAGYHYTVQHVGTHYQLTATTVAEHDATRFMLPAPKADHSKRLESPMPGVLVELLVKPGDRVKAGSPVATLEAMKMRNVLTAAADGVVKATPAKVGSNVDEGDVLVEFQ